MRQWLIGKLDARAVPEWRRAHKLWSVRVALFWATFGGIYMALPAFMGAMPPWVFGLLCIGMSVTWVLARITKQPGSDT
jgi:hypothetical protein